MLQQQSADGDVSFQFPEMSVKPQDTVTVSTITVDSWLFLRSFEAVYRAI